MALIVYFHDENVLTFFQLIGYVNIERSEATDMVGHVLRVHIDMAVVVYCTEV